MHDISSCDVVPRRSEALDQDDRLADLERAIRAQVLLRPPEPDEKLQLAGSGPFPLSPMEVRAFVNLYEKESSFRADYNWVLRRLLVVHTRSQSEIEICRRLQGTTFLWRDHVQALAHLSVRATETLKSAHSLLPVAAQKGLVQHTTELAMSIDRLERAVADAEALLAGRRVSEEPDPQFVYLPEDNGLVCTPSEFTLVAG